MQNSIEEKSHNELINSHPTPKNDKIQAIKKSPEGSILADTTCIKWWRLGDCLDLFALNVSTVFLFRNFVSSKEKTSALCSQVAEPPKEWLNPSPPKLRGQ